MPYKEIKGGVCAPKGFKANATAAGVKNADTTAPTLSFKSLANGAT